MKRTPQIIDFEANAPTLSSTAFLSDATIIGDVHIGEHASIWYGSVLRGDVMPIRIGARSNVQDQCVVHTTSRQSECHVGEDCTIGHGVILHGCRIRDQVLIGMGALILDHAEIGTHSIIGAGSLVTGGTVIPEGVLALGRPAKVIRELTDEERASLQRSARHYVDLAQRYA